MLSLCLAALACIGSVHGDNGEELFNWVRSMGGFIDPRLELSTGPEPSWQVRGLFATAPIEEGEELVKIPASAQICHPDMCGLIRLLRLEMLKREESVYWPYLKAMETHEIDYPNVWTEEERGLLVGLQPNDWTRHTDWYEWACWPSLRAELSGDNKEDMESPDAHAWRALHLYVARITTVLDQNCFIPVYDLANHRNGEELNTIWTTGNTPNVTIRASQAVGKGQQLWNQFGEGAGRMLRDYGFIEQYPSDFSVQGNDVICTWTLTEEETKHIRLDWKEFHDDCLSMLKEHLANLPPVPEIKPTMKASRVAVASQYRTNYINAVNLAIRSIPHDEL